MTVLMVLERRKINEVSLEVSKVTVLKINSSTKHRDKETPKANIRCFFFKIMD